MRMELSSFWNLTLGIASLSYAAFITKSTLHLLKCGLRGRGFVVENDMNFGDDGFGIEFIPIVEFTTANGQKVRFRSNLRTIGWLVNFRPGDRVSVLYLLEKPEKAIVESFLSLWMAPILLIVIGLVLLLKL